ncbi:hypothetical protein [Staphylococcus arlettae]|uniref:aldose epimerase family protein n=1 Tax=Staphylococcus arlettae TaxID=29378 RepID=UPI001F5421FC|nr:hypothetical protein [Staphylococcus arlettae]
MIENHYISSNKLAMYPLGEDNIVNSTDTIDLSTIFNSNKIQFKELFTSENPKIKQQMDMFNGVDHPFEVENGEMAVENKRFVLQVKTDMPNIVIFTFNDTSSWDSDFNIYKAHSGFTLETQCIPNDINLYGDKAPSIITPDQPYYSKTSYKIFEKADI